jgi:hypothetical protein
MHPLSILLCNIVLAIAIRQEKDIKLHRMRIKLSFFADTMRNALYFKESPVSETSKHE